MLNDVITVKLKINASAFQKEAPSQTLILLIINLSAGDSRLQLQGPRCLLIDQAEHIHYIKSVI